MHCDHSRSSAVLSRVVPVLQGDIKVRIYNNKVRRWAKAQGLWVLESYAFTKGEFSRDGVHYDDANIALAQLLLNYLARLQERQDLRVEPEASAADRSTYRLGDPTKVGVPVYKGPHLKNSGHVRRADETWGIL